MTCAKAPCSTTGRSAGTGTCRRAAGIFTNRRTPAPWGAAEAYQWTSRTSGPWNTYLLCYPDRFVEIEFDLKWTPTPAQMALAGERLGRDAV